MPTKKRIQYRYTPTGQRSALIDPDGGRFTYSYDNVKRLTQVLNPQGQRTTFAYDNAGRRTLKKLANGSRTSFSYDLANRITSVAQLKSDASLQARYDYKYDRAGNRRAMAESGVSTARTTWSYDAAYQLTGEHRTGANAFRNTFTYDNRGNRLLKNLDGARTTSSYDDANQLRWTQDVSGRTTYTFDADGNQQVVLTAAGQRTTSVWDYENKLIGVLNPSGTRETLAYDPDGKRVKQQTASDTAKYVWDQQNYLQETNASDVTQATYTNEPRTYGNLISQRRSGATHYYVFNALGSTRLLTDSAEAVSESLLYDAWGNLVTAAPTLAVPFRWVGELGYLFVPSTADYYVRARILRTSIARWLSCDPLGFRDGLNCFSYVRNRPTVFLDPTGMRICDLPPDPILAIMRRCLREEWKDEEDRISLATVACVACQESGHDYNPCALSPDPDFAVGIMQLLQNGAWSQCITDSAKSGIPTDATLNINDDSCCAESMNPVPECAPHCLKDAWNWDINVCCGVYYLKYCRDKIRPFVPLEDILACYNSGDYEQDNEETINFVREILECIPDMKTKLEGAEQ